jgi:hypothetical protein
VSSNFRSIWSRGRCAKSASKVGERRTLRGNCVTRRSRDAKGRDPGAGCSLNSNDRRNWHAHRPPG